MSVEKLRTSYDWYNDEELDYLEIISDPDGWDRKNYHYSFFKELITKQEFEKRLENSTLYY